MRAWHAEDLGVPALYHDLVRSRTASAPRWRSGDLLDPQRVGYGGVTDPYWDAWPPEVDREGHVYFELAVEGPDWTVFRALRLPSRTQHFL